MRVFSLDWSNLSEECSSYIHTSYQVHTNQPTFTVIVPHVNLSIGIKEQEEGKEKEMVVIIGGLWVVSDPERDGGVCLCVTDVTVKNSSENGLYASGAGTMIVLKNVTMKNCKRNGVLVQNGAKLDATKCQLIGSPQAIYDARLSKLENYRRDHPRN